MRGRRQTDAGLGQRDESGRDLLPADVEQKQRASLGAPPFGRTAGVENPDVSHTVGLRHVRVPVDDRTALREPSRKPAFATQPRPRDVDDRDPSLFDLDDALLRQQLA